MTHHESYDHETYSDREAPRSIVELVQELPEQLQIMDERTKELVEAIDQAPRAYPPGTFRPKNEDSYITHHQLSLQHSPDIQPEASTEEWAVPLPVDSFTGAPALQDWQGRETRESRTKVRQYASMSPHTAMPIQHVLVRVYDNGSVEAVLTGDGAHRLAAAMQRGDSHILARGVTVQQVTRET